MNEIALVSVALEEEHYEPGTKLISQGEVGQHFYIVQRVKCATSVTDVAEGGSKVAAGATTMVLGEEARRIFGEKALLIRTMSKCKCDCPHKVTLLSWRTNFQYLMLGLKARMQTRNEMIFGIPHVQ